MKTHHAGMADFYQGERPPVSGVLNYVIASYQHAALLMRRRQRLLLALVITLLPSVLPLSIILFSVSPYLDSGRQVFMNLAESLHMAVLAPLLGLFFATMLISEDVEAQTLPYILTRPIPRSAWVLGRFLAYLAVSSLLLGVALFSTYLSCLCLGKFPMNLSTLLLPLQFTGAGILALAAYGAMMMSLGALVRRPIVIGVIFMYAWQKLAGVLAGMVDFLTIHKYVATLSPSDAVRPTTATINTDFGAVQRIIFPVAQTHAVVVLLLITLAFLAATVVVLRVRQFYASQTIT